MNKKLKLVLIFLLFLNSFSIVKADEIDDYSSTYQTYAKTFQEFSLSKQIYLKNQTLSAKNDFIEKSQNLLITRAKIFRTYFLALRFKLNKTSGSSASDIKIYTDILNQQISWLEKNIEELENLTDPTLVQIQNYSINFEQNEELFMKLSYQVLSLIQIAKINKLNEDLDAINKQFEPYISESFVSYLNNWYRDSQTGYFQVSSVIKNSKIQLVSIDNTGLNRITQIYAQINSQLEEAKNILLKSLGFHKEIINQLNQDFSKNG